MSEDDKSNSGSGSGKSAKRSVHNLESLLKSLCEETDGDKVTVSDLLGAVGRRSYGPVLALLGFVSISPLTLIPGTNWLISLVTLLFALQMAIGMNYPWLPNRILEFSFKRKYLVDGIDTFTPYTSVIDRYLKPRLTFLTGAPFAQLVALICIAATLVSFPLSFFPFGPVLPGLTVLLFGLAITARDGFVLISAAAVLVAAFLVLRRVWNALPSLDFLPF